MKTANEKIQDSLVQHQVHLLRYANGLTKKSATSIVKTEEDLERIITFYAARLTRPTLTPKRRKELELRMLREVRELRRAAWREAAGVINAETKALAGKEAVFYIKNFEKHLPFELDLQLPRGAELSRKALATPIEGAIMSDWMRAGERSDIETIVRRVKKGVSNNLDASDVVRGVMGTKRLSYKDGVSRRAVRNSETLVLTSVNNTSHSAASVVNSNNAWFIKEEIFTATLDGSTTLICMGYDGNKYPVNDGPVPPVHFRCRSRRIPFVTPESVASRPYDPSTQKSLVREFTRINNMDITSNRSALPRGTKGQFDKWARGRRRELIGKVPERTTYQQWLKRQSAEFQNDVLGKGRAEAFRKGEVTLDNFTDFNGRTLTLEELEKKGLKSLTT